MLKYFRPCDVSTFCHMPNLHAATLWRLQVTIICAVLHEQKWSPQPTIQTGPLLHVAIEVQPHSTNDKHKGSLSMFILCWKKLTFSHPIFLKRWPDTEISRTYWKKFSEWGGHYHNRDPPHRRGNHKLHPTYKMNTRDYALLLPNQEVEDIQWSSCNRWHIYTVHPTLLIFIAISKNIVKAHTRKMGIPVCFAARNIAVAHSLTYWEEKDGKNVSSIILVCYMWSKPWVL